MQITTIFFFALNAAFVYFALMSKTCKVNSNEVYNCTDNSDCNYKGICTSKNVCQCDDGYITFPQNHSTDCNYKQKSAKTALLLQLFLGLFGAGYFYLGVIDLGLGELFLFWGGFIFVCMLGCIIVCVKNNQEQNPNYDIVSAITNLFICLVMVGSFIWWIYSMVTIGNGTQLDGNGATLADL